MASTGEIYRPWRPSVSVVHRAARGPSCSRYFPFLSDPFRPSTYLGPGPSARERPRNTKTGRLPARVRAPGRMELLGISSGRGWALPPHGSRRSPSGSAKAVWLGGVVAVAGPRTALQGRSTANGASTGAGGAELANYLPPQAERTTERQRSGPRPANEVFALHGRTGTGQCPVAVTGQPVKAQGLRARCAPAAQPCQHGRPRAAVVKDHYRIGWRISAMTPSYLWSSPVDKSMVMSSSIGPS